MRIYITKEGDRWDWISYIHYGHPDYYKEIIKANPRLPEEVKKVSKLPGGIKLVIPDVKVEPKPIEGLPPWKK
ncbi:MAG: tail protein X [Nanopusillaceae archaeon]